MVLHFGFPQLLQRLYSSHCLASHVQALPVPAALAWWGPRWLFSPGCGGLRTPCLFSDLSFPIADGTVVHSPLP